MRIIIIAAVADNNIIGRRNDLPWHIPEDLQHFKKLTSGKIVLMGKNTYESIVSRLGTPLPNRRNIVLTNEENYQVLPGVELIDHISKLEKIVGSDDIYIIGGASLYNTFLSKANILEITHVHQEPEGDTYFPEVNWSDWEEIKRDDYEVFSFVTYQRK